MHQNGWTKLHPETLALWIHLLSLANKKDQKLDKQTVKRGSFVTSFRSLAMLSGLSQRKTRTALSNLHKIGEIALTTTHRHTVISLNKYEEYQTLTVVKLAQMGTELQCDTVNDTVSDTVSTSGKSGVSDTVNDTVTKNSDTVSTSGKSGVSDTVKIYQAEKMAKNGKKEGVKIKEKEKVKEKTNKKEKEKEKENRSLNDELSNEEIIHVAKLKKVSSLIVEKYKQNYVDWIESKPLAKETQNRSMKATVRAWIQRDLDLGRIKQLSQEQIIYNQMTGGW